jgi:kumamolisin
MSGSRQRSVEIADSAREAPKEATLVGDVDPEAPLAITLHFRRRTPPAPPGSAEDLARLRRPIARATLDRQRARTHARAAARIAEFMRANGVKVRDVDFTRRRMELEAPTRVLTALFGATVHRYSEDGEVFLARTGALEIPRHIAPWTRAVVGFDQRPLRPRPASGVEGDAATALWPTDVAQLYGVPLDIDVSRQCVGIIAMGGGYQRTDLDAALVGMRRGSPDLIDQSVGGATNRFGLNPRADMEIALDLQVLAGLLPGARIVVYFCSPTQQGMADALAQAAYDKVNNPRVVSLSWGDAEGSWTAQRREAVCATLCDAARLGISVVAASGDQLATCGMDDGKAHVWFPASSPYGLGCGGTSTKLAGTTIITESVWKAGAIGTGGGISDCYPVADFQLQAALPSSVNDGHAGRGVPDVAALAASPPGYRVVIDDTATPVDGTSAATPVWAALIAMANASRSSPLGLVAPHLYAAQALMRPITDGDNQQNGIGYSARAGWSACTGLGVPRGASVVAGLAAVP